MPSDGQPLRMRIEKLQPSQLYLSQSKIQRLVLAPIKAVNTPIPVKLLDDEIIITDGHTRTYLQWTYGFREITVEWEDEDLGWDEYRTCVGWCKEEGVRKISDLRNRALPDDDYKKLWLDRCREIWGEREEKASGSGQSF